MTNDTEIIMERLAELERNLRAHADQIRSDLEDLIKRIGSDPVKQDKKIGFDPGSSEAEIKASDNSALWLESYALRLGVNLGGLDLRGIARNIDWFRKNIDTIRYPEAYLKKMVAGCGPKTGFVTSKPEIESQARVKEEDPDEGMIMGVKKEDVEDKMIYWDLHTYNQIRPKLEAYGKMFHTFDACSESIMKKRVAVAIAIKEGAL